ncbi:MAG: hypothetical protein ACTSU4_04675, partial [Promethearchaeota archaeon]
INEMNARFEAVDKRFETLINEMNARFEAVDKRFETLIKEMDKRFEEASKERDDLRRLITTVSTRTGFNLQDLVLNLLSDKLIQENIDKSNITREFLYDLDGSVYSIHYTTDIDVVIRDGKVYLMEIKSTADNRDIADLILKGKLYKMKHEKGYDGLIMACLEIKKEHLEYANKLGIHVIAGKII